MRISLARAAGTITYLVFVAGSIAQPSAKDPWSDLRSSNPAGLQFSLRLQEPREYRRGELIIVEVNFPGQTPAPGTPPREIWQAGGFLLDPQSDCGSLEKRCLSGSGRLYNGAL